MPHGENLDFEHQSAAGKRSWSTRRTTQDKINHLRAVGNGMLRRADELAADLDENAQHHGEQVTP